MTNPPHTSYTLVSLTKSTAQPKLTKEYDFPPPVAIRKEVIRHTTRAIFNAEIVVYDSVPLFIESTNSLNCFVGKCKLQINSKNWLCGILEENRY
jgi:hypothetical protein